jgi:hypothetical protein
MVMPLISVACNYINFEFQIYGKCERKIKSGMSFVDRDCFEPPLTTDRPHRHVPIAIGLKRLLRNWFILFSIKIDLTIFEGKIILI